MSAHFPFYCGCRPVNTTAAVRSIEERLQQVADHAHAFVPTEEDWGFYGYSDASPDGGGGVGGFLWFHTREEMLDFIRHSLPFWNGGLAHCDVGIVCARVSKILDCLNAANPGEAYMSQLNQTLKGYTQIKWWGPFGELVSGETAFARDIRVWFRENTSAGKGNGPIPAPDKSTFSELLQEYGM
jgi:hypothetical protein